MPEDPDESSYAPVYEPSFEEDLCTLGLQGRNFDYFFRKVEEHICTYPFESSTEVPDGEGMRMQPTHEAFLDLPPLYIYFRVSQDEGRVYFFGLTPAWGQQ